MAVNCAGLPETLLESELFGHVKGSFTGAYRDKPGKLELADRGTMFLDEIGEMTLRMQGLLLRFLETGELQKVGADRVGRARRRPRHRRDQPQPARDDRAGQFREDLFYRLNVIHLTVPPLRERREDIPALANHFLDAISPATAAYVARAMSPEALEALIEYHWPGNVRELENVIERLVVTGATRRFSRDDLPLEIRVAQRRRRSRRGRSAAARWPTTSTSGWSRSRESFWTAVYPLYMQREITALKRARPRAQGARGSARQLQDRRAAVQHGPAATTSSS